ncbi:MULTISPECIES: hypothetical protein [Alphaproteobacteria]|uniref:DUF883 domain-containing protein n=2 Tax=Alphaproteobacteria TaxID=28211 RepID=A0A512HF66_9HYPH|nr:MULTISPECIES: hypothetical protein [Alphaproteobacteria]GEO84104.1 hypothetical protein RNA01_10360 [Ciceribacter naphthalenivorans]GLR24640.1 hypothetical protein GCM10007920_44340 [Ciceribacter naphthalenivorans]GLT07496.1 hypothetical protein GCM10007926_44340 [Sphingomonas psychrolutea]
MANNNDMMNELRSLQAQVMHFKELLSAEGEKASDDARGRAAALMNGAGRKVQDAASLARDEVVSMGSIVREHPTATSTALLTAGIVGGLIGYFLATASHSPSYTPRRWL